MSSPTAEQERRGTRRAVRQVVDDRGEAGWPFVAPTLLGTLEARGAISPAMRRAGEIFHETFFLAHLHGLRSAPLDREPRSGGYAPQHEPVSVERAKGRVHEAIKALGGSDSVAGRCCWFVVGCDDSVRGWVLREATRGHPISESVGKGPS